MYERVGSAITTTVLLAAQVKADTGNDTDVVLTIVYGIGDSSVDPVDFAEC